MLVLKVNYSKISNSSLLVNLVATGGGWIFKAGAASSALT
jgi:hypothetical protein